MNPIPIILVEDDLNLRQSILLILQRAGYLVTATEYINQVMDLMASGQFHLIISDNNIPETQTVLIPKLLGIYPCLCIVILTDQLSAGAEKRGKPYKVQYLVKPIAPERLLDTIDLILAHQLSSNLNKNAGLLINADRDCQ